ncbi:hypothetical protein DE4585_04743 [Mycobacteroides salmoniphilum]|uniref:Uncharacterized protein n=1 Tax=Mycobacteroides salmoniphilum TaxID=404941 RepID=A0A4R8RX26_9MYCO|nr:hypothetical protein DE4585_04743 [Mycobacteroides salmoniphilum]
MSMCGPAAEVLVRHAGYEWVDNSPEAARYTFPLTVYRAAAKTHANPIGKAFKRVDNGDSVAYFYQVFAAGTDLSGTITEPPTRS